MAPGSAPHPSVAPTPVSTKEQILRFLQASGRATVGELALHCGVSDAALRQHLDQLEVDGLVCRTAADNNPENAVSGSRGRPPSHWTLSETSTHRGHSIFPDTFPDRHAELSGDILRSLASTMGEAAVIEVLDHRSRRQIDDYRAAVDAHLESTRTNERRPRLVDAVAALATIRDGEGYRAESIDHGDGTVSLVERHCAIDAAARTCDELCASEMKVFGKVLDRTLGTRVAIRRVEHLMSGGTCCRYEIRPR